MTATELLALSTATMWHRLSVWNYSEENINTTPDTTLLTQPLTQLTSGICGAAESSILGNGETQPIRLAVWIKNEARDDRKRRRRLQQSSRNI